MFNFKIGVSTSSLYKGVQDGIAHYTAQLIQALNLMRCPVKEICFSGEGDDHKISNESQDAILLPHSFYYYALSSLLNLNKFSNTCQPKIDLFHSTDHKVIAMGCPVVATFHDAISLLHPEWMSGHVIQKFLALKFLKKGTKLADHIITVSYHSADEILECFKIKDDKITVIHNAIDNVWFNPIALDKQERVLKKYNLDEGYFLSVGSIQPRKNYDRVLDAYLTLPLHIRHERKLVILGKPKVTNQLIVARLIQMQKENQIIWLSNVDSDDDLRCIYKGACALVFPSLHEGFGLPVVEAFASGLPVICSNTTALPEVSGGAALEINPESVGEIAEAMQWFATNEQAREKHTQLGHARAQHFRRAETARKTIEVYEKVLKAS